MKNKNKETVSLRPNDSLSGDLLQAVIEFQRERNLVQDGILGPQTLTHFMDALNYSSPKITAPDSENPSGKPRVIHLKKNKGV